MHKLLLSALLITPCFTNARHWNDLTTSKVRNLAVPLDQTFTITAVHGPRHQAKAWHLAPYAPFELLSEGWNDGCIGIMEANTQIWNFNATQIGTYEIEFYRPYPSPMQAVDTAKVSVEVY